MNRIVFVLLLVSAFTSTAQPTLSTKSNRAIELYTEADNYRVRGQHTQAIELLNEAISKDKKFFEAYYRLGLVYLTIKNYSKAIEFYPKQTAWF